MTQSFGMRRLTLDREIERIGGTPLPDQKQAVSHLDTLADECETVLKKETGLIRLVHSTSASAEAVFQWDDKNAYYVNVDPNFAEAKPDVDAGAWRTASLLHEIMHVRCGRAYRQPHDKGVSGFYNFHLPVRSGDAAIGASIMAQNDVVQANYRSLSAVVGADTRLDARRRRHLARRIEYGDARPDVHYDTVLLDMLVILTLDGPAKGTTHDLVVAMSEEATDRRNDGDGTLSRHF